MLLRAGAAPARLFAMSKATRIEGRGYSLTVLESPEGPLEFARSVADRLRRDPRWLDYKYLYDAAGSEIFDRITEQPEYYLTRTERSILAERAGEIRRAAGSTTLVELGSGSSDKTRLLLEAWTAAGPTRYVPVDISRTALESACAGLASSFPDLAIDGIAGSFEDALPRIAGHSPQTLLFLGSSIGNMNVVERAAFFAAASRSLSPGDSLVLGLDLVKDPVRLEAAYDDEAGWSALFTKNLFVRMNRELGTAIPIDAIEHVAYYNDRRERIEIYAEFGRAVTIDLLGSGRSFRIAPRERLRTEISRKFRVDRMSRELAKHGFERVRCDLDPEADFAVLTLRRVLQAGPALPT